MKIREFAAVVMDACQSAQDVGLAAQARAYSGRGMMGKECLGVALHNTSPLAFGLFMADNLRDRTGHDFSAVDLMKYSLNIDSFGHGQILYWDQVPWHIELVNNETVQLEFVTLDDDRVDSDALWSGYFL